MKIKLQKVYIYIYIINLLVKERNQPYPNLEQKIWLK